MLKRDIGRWDLVLLMINCIIGQKDGKGVLVCTVGKTVLFYNIDCIKDLHEMLKAHGNWMELGSAMPPKANAQSQRPCAQAASQSSWQVKKK